MLLKLLTQTHIYFNQCGANNNNKKKLYYYYHMKTMIRFLVMVCVCFEVCNGQCSPGNYRSSVTGLCAPCTGNTYCATSYCGGACNACPPNSMPDAGRTNCVSGQCGVCPLGSYCGGGNLIFACPAGTFGAFVGLSNASGCTPCGPGTFTSGGGFTVCQDCAAGAYASGIRFTACLDCAVGYYQASARSLSCIGCPAGTFYDTTPILIRNTITAACTVCPIGTFSISAVSSACTLCGPGTYAQKNIGGTSEADACIGCRAGSYSTGFGTLYFCAQCMPGTYQDLPRSIYCVACFTGSYFTGTGATSVVTCQGCPRFSTTANTGAPSPQLCTCNAGFFTSNNNNNIFNATQNNTNALLLSLSNQSTTSSGGPQCDACLPGSYSTVSNATGCTLCDANTYDPSTLDTTIRDSGVCQYVATNCWSPKGAITFFANAGYYRVLEMASCRPCPLATFSTAGLQTLCNSCNNNGYTTSVGTVDAKGCLCNAGYYSSALFPNLTLSLDTVAATNNNNVVCVGCPPSGYHYCMGGASGPTQCPPFSGTVGNACRCNAGYTTLSGGCQLCSPGFYCSPTAVYSCPLRSFSASGSSSVNECKCNAGFFASRLRSDGCVPCLAGSFCVSGVAIACGNNSMAPTGSTSSVNCSCISGFYQPPSSSSGNTNNNIKNDSMITAACIPCPTNAYCIGVNNKNNQPIACPANSTTLGLTQRSSDSACICNQGFAQVLGLGCVGCSANYYCIGDGTSVACISQSASAPFSVNASACRCNAGYVGSQATGCVPCPAGTFYDYYASVCLTCAVGTYSTALGGCISCGIGTYSSASGANFAGTCVACPSSTFSSVIGASVCALCGVGKFSMGTGAIASSVCVGCLSGTYSTGMGGSCAACLPGSFSTAIGAVVCIGCDSITAYASGIGATACDKCPMGASAINKTGCVFCAPGTFFFNSNNNNNDTLPCKLCPQGTFSPNASMGCIACTAGSYSVEAGTTSPCPLCAPGTIGDPFGCTLCDVGTYSTAMGNAMACRSCSAGTYNTGSGALSSAACLQCPGGYYSPMLSARSSSTCVGCSAGSFSTASGAITQATCILCPSGGFSSIGSVSCNICRAGTAAVVF